MVMAHGERERFQRGAEFLGLNRVRLKPHDDIAEFANDGVDIHHRAFKTPFHLERFAGEQSGAILDIEADSVNGLYNVVVKVAPESFATLRGVG
jgi:hypothetical protein